MTKDSAKIKKAVVSLLELAQAAGSTDTYSDLFDWNDRTLDKATHEILDVLFDD